MLLHPLVLACQKEKQLARIRAELFSTPQAYTSRTGPEASTPQAYTSTTEPAGGDRLGSGSRGLASFGFVVRPGPALPPVEDPPPAPSLPGTGQSETNLW